MTIPKAANDELENCSELHPQQRWAVKLVRNLVEDFESSNALEGFWGLSIALLRQDLRGKVYSNFHEDCLILQDPSYSTLRFICDRSSGKISVLATKTWHEVALFDCTTGKGRHDLIVFLVEWRKLHAPPPPSPRLSPESDTELPKPQRISTEVVVPVALKRKKITAGSILGQRKAQHISGARSNRRVQLEDLSELDEETPAILEEEIVVKNVTPTIVQNESLTGVGKEPEDTN